MPAVLSADKPQFSCTVRSFTVIFLISFSIFFQNARLIWFQHNASDTRSPVRRSVYLPFRTTYPSAFSVSTAMIPFSLPDRSTSDTFPLACAIGDSPTRRRRSAAESTLPTRTIFPFPTVRSVTAERPESSPCHIRQGSSSRATFIGVVTHFDGAGRTVRPFCRERIVCNGLLRERTDASRFLQKGKRRIGIFANIPVHDVGHGTDDPRSARSHPFQNTFFEAVFIHTGKEGRDHYFVSVERMRHIDHIDIMVTENSVIALYQRIAVREILDERSSVKQVDRRTRIV